MGEGEKGAFGPDLVTYAAAIDRSKGVEWEAVEELRLNRMKLNGTKYDVNGDSEGCLP